MTDLPCVGVTVTRFTVRQQSTPVSLSGKKEENRRPRAQGEERGINVAQTAIPLPSPFHCWAMMRRVLFLLGLCSFIGLFPRVDGPPVNYPFHCPAVEKEHYSRYRS